MPKNDTYSYGPYLVFSDMSTFCSDVDDAVIAYITDTAQIISEMQTVPLDSVRAG